MKSRLEKSSHSDILVKEESYFLPVGPANEMREVGRVRVVINPFPAPGEGFVCGVTFHANGHNMHTRQEVEDFAEMAGAAADFVRRMNAPAGERLQTIVAQVDGSHLPEWLMRAHLQKDGANGLHVLKLMEGDATEIEETEQD